MEYGNKVLAALQDAGIRAEIDTRAEKIGYKIREAQMKKIPYMLVVGAKEEEEEKVSVRKAAKNAAKVLMLLYGALATYLRADFPFTDKIFPVLQYSAIEVVMLSLAGHARVSPPGEQSAAACSR